MALMGHGTFNSNKVYFVLITYVIEHRRELAKIAAKSKKKTIIQNRYFRFQNWVCQNVSNEVLLAWLKFQTKIPNCSEVCVQGEWQKYTTPFPPLSKVEELSDIGHSMSIGNLMIITKCDGHYYKMRQLFYYKMRQKFIKKCIRFLLQNVTVLLQNATVVTNCDDFIIKFDSYYKMQRYYKLLQYSMDYI